MPAGSGPLPVTLTAVAVPTAEGVIATVPASSWNNSSGLGNLLEFAGTFTPPGTGGSLVLRLRQGTTVVGTQVGSTITVPFTAATAGGAGIIAVDASAFGNLQTGGQYVLTAAYAAASGGAITGVLTLETAAPIL